MKAYRVNITKSRAGHYRLTLIDKADRYLKVTGLGWSTPEQARIMDEEKLAAELEMYRARTAKPSVQTLMQAAQAMGKLQIINV